MAQITYTDADYDHVSAKFACPDCGEDRTDHLVLNYDDTIECLSCGAIYEERSKGDDTDS